MTARRLVRSSFGLIAAASLASTLGLMTGASHVQAATGFTCAPGISEACAVVFGPVCRKPFQPCY